MLAGMAGICQSLSNPQVLELSISTPQPRLKESFKIMLDENYVRAQIFKSASGKIRLADNPNSSNDGKMVLNVNALVKGKNEIGPLEFTLNGTTYSTNKIEYEVVDPLPNVNRGIWIRKVNLSDSTFCIIIEQRIPAYEKTTVTSENSTSYTTEPEHDDIFKFKESYSVKGLNLSNSYANSEYSSIYDERGEQKQFLSAYAVYYFTINNKSSSIIITKDKFDNIPAEYKFENIVIR